MSDEALMQRYARNASFRAPDSIQSERTAQAERTAQGRQQAQRLHMLVEKLPIAKREAFMLRQEGDLSVEEIAAVTGNEREAIKCRLRDALNQLRRGMGDLS